MTLYEMRNVFPHRFRGQVQQQCASWFYKSKTEKVAEGRKSAILPNCCCLLFITVLFDPPWATPMSCKWFASSRICSEGLNNLFIHFHTVRESNSESFTLKIKATQVDGTHTIFQNCSRPPYMLSVVNLEEIWPQWNGTVEANVWRRIQSGIMIRKLPT